MSEVHGVSEVPVQILDQVCARLQEKRVALEKVVLAYGEAPAGIKEVFELCRGFERAYTNFVNESPVASKIKEAFAGEKGLAGTLKGLPLDKTFKLDNVKAVCKTADGYYPSLMSPEKGLRQLAAEALDYVTDPVQQCVQQVYTLLINAAREAAEKAGQFTEAALMGSMPMYVPDFKNVVMPAIVQALDEWKKEAFAMAMMLVDMERSYITAGFFRHTMHNRYQKIKQQEQMRLAAAPAEPKGVKAAAQKLFPAFGQKQEPASSPNGTGAPTGPDGGDSSPFGKVAAPAKADEDFVAAYFEKQSSEDAVLSSRWQKRYFVYDPNTNMLYYFKAAEEVGQDKLRGQVNIAECIVEDLDDKGNPRTPNSPPPSNPQDKSNCMLRIRNRNPNSSVMKDHNMLVLRAENLQTKIEWVQRLRRASQPPKRPAPAAPQADGQPVEDGEAQAQPAKPPASTGFQDFQDDLSWTKDLDPILDNHLGEGARAFRADNVRDQDGRLLPAPMQLLNPMRLQERLKGGNKDAFQVRYDALMEQFGNDMSVYMQMVCDTVIVTVPKAIVHCMIKKSEKNLLEKMFHIIHNLTNAQMEQLLKEDAAVVQKRGLARKFLEDVKTAVWQVQQAQEKYNMAPAADRKEKLLLPISIFAYASLTEFLNPDQKKEFEGIFNDAYAPDCVRFTWRPVPLLPTQQQPQQAQPKPGQAGPAPQRPPVPGPTPGAAAPLARPSATPMARPAPTGPVSGPIDPKVAGMVMPSDASMTARRAAPPPPPGATPMGPPMAPSRRAPPAPPGR